MRYQGSKSQIAKQIAEVICQRERESKDFVSLFCGALPVECRVKQSGMFENIVCNDLNHYLIDMYEALQDGWIPPGNVTKEFYKEIQNNKEKYSNELVAFVGYGCSYGGKFFNGYAKGEGRNYADEARRALLRDSHILKDAKFTCLDYRDVELPDGCVVYADSPYENTTGYITGKFDHALYWQYMREISKDHLVFISELNAPDDFECIWEKQVTRTLDINPNNQFKATEKLFIHKCNSK